MAKKNKNIQELTDLKNLLSSDSGSLQDNIKKTKDVVDKLSNAFNEMSGKVTDKSLSGSKLGVKKLIRELNAYISVVNQAGEAAAQLRGNEGLDGVVNSTTKSLNKLLITVKELSENFTNARKELENIGKVAPKITTGQVVTSTTPVQSDSTKKKLASLDDTLDLKGLDGPAEKLDAILKALRLVSNEVQALGVGAIPKALGASSEGFDSILANLKYVEEAQARVTNAIEAFRTEYPTSTEEGGLLFGQLKEAEDANLKLLTARLHATKEVTNAVEALAEANRLSEEQAKILAKHFGGDVERMTKYNALLQTQVKLRTKIDDLIRSRASNPEHTTFEKYFTSEGYNLDEVLKSIETLSSMGEEAFATAGKVRMLHADLKALSDRGFNLDAPSTKDKSLTVRQQYMSEVLNLQGENLPTAENFERVAKNANLLLSELTNWTKYLREEGSTDVAYLTDRILSLRKSLYDVNDAIRDFNLDEPIDEVTHRVMGSHNTIEPEDFQKHKAEAETNRKQYIQNLLEDASKVESLWEKTNRPYEGMLEDLANLNLRLEAFKDTVGETTKYTDAQGKEQTIFDDDANIKKYLASLETLEKMLDSLRAKTKGSLALGSVDHDQNLALRHAGPSVEATSLYERALADILNKEIAISKALAEQVKARTQGTGTVDEQLAQQEKINALTASEVALAKAALEQEQASIVAAKEKIEALERTRRLAVENYMRENKISPTATGVVSADVASKASGYLTDEQILRVATGTARLEEYKLALRGIQDALERVGPHQVAENQALYELRDAAQDAVYAIEGNLHKSVTKADEAIQSQTISLEELVKVKKELERHEARMKTESTSGEEDLTISERLAQLNEKIAVAKERQAAATRLANVEQANSIVDAPDVTLGELQKAKRVLEAEKLELFEASEADKIDDLNTKIAKLTDRIKATASASKELKNISSAAIDEYNNMAGESVKTIDARILELKKEAIVPGLSKEQVATYKERLKGLTIARKEALDLEKQALAEAGVAYNDYMVELLRATHLTDEELLEGKKKLERQLLGLDEAEAKRTGSKTNLLATEIRRRITAYKEEIKVRKEAAQAETPMSDFRETARSYARDLLSSGGLDAVREKYKEINEELEQLKDASKLAGEAATKASKIRIAELDIERQAYQEVIKEQEKLDREADGDGGSTSSSSKKSGFFGSVSQASKLARYITSGYMMMKMLKSVYGVFKEGVKYSLQFEQALANLNAITQATTREQTLMYHTVKKAAMGTNLSLKQVTDTATNIAKLGFSSYEITQMLTPITQFTVATQESAQAVGNLLGATIRSYELNFSDAKEIMDLFAQSMNSSAISFDYLSTSMKIIGPVARAANLGLKDTLVYLGTLANAGLDASRGATALRNILLHMANANSSLAKTLGFVVKDTGDVAKAFAVLNEKAYDLGDTLQLTDKRSVAAFNRLLTAGPELEALARKMDNAGGAVERMREEQLKSTITSWETLTNATKSWFDTILGSWQGLQNFFTKLRKQIDLTNAKLLMGRGQNMANPEFGITGFTPGVGGSTTASESFESYVISETRKALMQKNIKKITEAAGREFSSLKELDAYIASLRGSKGIKSNYVLGTLEKLTKYNPVDETSKKVYWDLFTKQHESQTWENVSKNAVERDISIPSKMIVAIRDRAGITIDNYEEQLTSMLGMSYEDYLKDSKSYKKNKPLMTSAKDRFEIVMDEVAYKMSNDVTAKATENIEANLSELASIIQREGAAGGVNIDEKLLTAGTDFSYDINAIKSYTQLLSKKIKDEKVVSRVGTLMAETSGLMDALNSIPTLAGYKPTGTVTPKGGGQSPADRWAKFMEKVKADKQKALSQQELKLLEDESALYRKIAQDATLSFEVREAASQDWFSTHTKYLAAANHAELVNNEESIRLQYLRAKGLTSMNKAQHEEYLAWYAENYTEKIEAVNLKYTNDYTVLYEEVSKNRLTIAQREHNVLNKIREKDYQAVLADIDRRTAAFKVEQEHKANMTVKDRKENTSRLGFLLFSETEEQSIRFATQVAIMENELSAAVEKLTIQQAEHASITKLLNDRRKEQVMSAQELEEVLVRVNAAVERGTMSEASALNIRKTLSAVTANGTLAEEEMTVILQELAKDAELSEEQIATLTIALANLKSEGFSITGDWGQPISKGMKKSLEGFKKISDVAITYMSDWADVITDNIQQQIDALTKLHEKEMEAMQERHDKELELLDARSRRISESRSAGLLSEKEADAQSKILAAHREMREKQMAEDKRKKEEAFNKQRIGMEARIAKYQKAITLMNIAQAGAIAMMNALGLFAKNPALGTPVMIAVGALTAAQLAAEAARPIPQYAKGTSFHPGGPAIVGDGGKHELIITPSKPTVMNLPRGAKVLPDATEFLASRTASIGNLTYAASNSYDVVPDVILQGLTKQSVSELRQIVSLLNVLNGTSEATIQELNRQRFTNKYK